MTKIIDKLLQNVANQRFQSADKVMQAMGIECKSQQLKLSNPLWDCSSTLTEYSVGSSSLNALAFSPEGKILASTNDEKNIKLWDLKTKKFIASLLGHSQAIKSVAFSHDGEILASGSWDKTIKLWNINTGAEICTLTGHQLQVNSVAFSPQGQILASASYDRTTRLWQINSQKEFKNCPCYTLLGILWGHA